jgi:hypothetical protein
MAAPLFGLGCWIALGLLLLTLPARRSAQTKTIEIRAHSEALESA